MYYLRTRPAVDAVQFTVDKLALTDKAKVPEAHADKENVEHRAVRGQRAPFGQPQPSKYDRVSEEDEGCLMCSG